MENSLDLEILNELVDIMGDDMSMLLNSYMDDSRDKLAQLEKMDLSSDQESIFRMAHSLKGSSRNVGVVEFSNLCEQIELLARAGTLTDSDFEIVKLNQLFEVACQLLTKRYL